MNAWWEKTILNSTNIKLYYLPHESLVFGVVEVFHGNCCWHIDFVKHGLNRATFETLRWMLAANNAIPYWHQVLSNDCLHENYRAVIYSFIGYYSTLWGKKTAPFYFCNSFVRTSSFMTMFGTRIHSGADPGISKRGGGPFSSPSLLSFPCPLPFPSRPLSFPSRLFPSPSPPVPSPPLPLKSRASLSS